MKSFIFCLLSILAFSTPCLAETAFQFTAPGLRAPDDPTVSGMRFSLLYGKTENVSGFDLGLSSFSSTGNSTGLAAILGIHQITGKSTGLQASLINIHSGEAAGINMAFINSIQKMGQGGINIGFLNVTKGSSNVEISGMAISDSARVQIGFINVTERIDSIQIGFLNFAQNGFLPVFPIFNFPKKQ